MPEILLTYYETVCYIKLKVLDLTRPCVWLNIHKSKEDNARFLSAQKSRRIIPGLEYPRILVVSPNRAVGAVGTVARL